MTEDLKVRSDGAKIVRSIVFSNDSDILQRVLKVSGKMLEVFGFWGNFDIETKSAKVSFQRSENWESCFEELNINNYLQTRITRMLMFWGCVKLWRWQVPFIIHIMFEIYVFGHLSKLRVLVAEWIQNVASRFCRELVVLNDRAMRI